LSEFFVIIFGAHLINLKFLSFLLLPHPLLSQFILKLCLLLIVSPQVIIVLSKLIWKEHQPSVWLLIIFKDLFSNAGTFIVLNVTFSYKQRQKSLKIKISLFEVHDNQTPFFYKLMKQYLIFHQFVVG